MNSNAQVSIDDFNEYVNVEKELIEITKATSREVGDQFFLALAKSVQKSLQVSYVLVGRVIVNDGDQCIQTLVLQGEEQIPNFTYSLRGAPCQHVVDQKIYYHPCNIQPAFPDDALLEELSIESYLGYPMIDIDGKTVGMIAVMDTREMSEAKRAYILSILWVIANRGAAEIHYAIREENLENTIQKRTEELVSARMKLVEQDKMAGLGKMVAGFAHELNTPIGVAVTASSGLSSMTQSIKAELGSEKVSRSKLLSIADRIVLVAELVESNLNRAVELVTNFKRVSVDLSEDRKAKINLAESIDTLVKAHHSVLTNAKINVDCQIDPTLTVVLPTGALGQILSNLLSNTIHHAYPNDDPGLITIQARKEPNVVIITYQDNGIGLTPEIAKNIYEPFFTTKRARGGTGLGMSIVHDIVTKLGGELELDTNTGKGFKLAIKVPIKS